MDFVLRVIGVGALVLAAVGLGLAVLFSRRARPVRFRFDVMRILAALASAVAIAAVSGAWPAGWLIGLALVAGGALGVVQGLSLRVTFGAGGVVVRRGAAALALWGLGVLIAQGAGVANRASALQLGLVVSYFGVGLMLGFVLGRGRAISRARRAQQTVRVRAAVSLIALFALVAGGFLLAPWQPSLAQAPGDEPETVSDDEPVLYVGTFTDTGSLEFKVEPVNAPQFVTCKQTGDAELRIFSDDRVVATLTYTELVNLREGGCRPRDEPLPVERAGNADGAGVSLVMCASSPQDMMLSFDGDSLSGSVTCDPTDRGNAISTQEIQLDLSLAAPKESDGAEPDQTEADDEVAAAATETTVAELEAEEEEPSEEGAVGLAGEGAEQAGEAEVAAAGEDEGDGIGAGAAAAAGLAGLVGTALVLGTTLVEAGASAEKVMEALSSGGWEGLRGLAGDYGVGQDLLPEFEEEIVPVEWRNNREELNKSLVVADAIGDNPDEVQGEILAEAARAMDAEQYAEVLEAARRVAGHLDPNDRDYAKKLAESGIVDLLANVPKEIQGKISKQLVADGEERAAQRAEQTAAEAMAQQQAVDLLGQAIRAGDARRAQEILKGFDKDTAAEVLRRATLGRQVDLDAMRRQQEEPGAEVGPVDAIAPVEDVGDFVNIALNDLLAPVRPEERRQIEAKMRPRIREGLENDLTRQALEEGERLGGDLNPFSKDFEDKLRESGFGDMLGNLPEHLQEPVRREFIRGLERSHVQEAEETTRATLEKQKAVALIREAVDHGDARRAQQILKGFDKDTGAEVLRRAIGGGEADFQAMVDDQVPGSGETGPVNLLPDNPREVLLDNPDVEEALRDYLPEVRKRVKEQLPVQMEAELEQAAVQAGRRAAGEIDPSLDDMSELLQDNPQFERALKPVPKHMQGKVWQEVADGLNQERLQQGVEAARHAAEMERAEEGLRRAMETGDFDRADSILRGLDPNDAEELSRRVKPQG